MENQESDPVQPTISWTGNFPQNYEDNLNFIFGPYADDLASRVHIDGLQRVLELACGTGAVTRRLISRLPKTTQLIATDLSPEMMKVGESLIQVPNVQWKIVDMTEIPFPDKSFELIICQFGLMFAPDKYKALKEMSRVLKPNGKLLFNTWGLIEENPVFSIFSEVTKSLIGPNFGAMQQGPFSMQDHNSVLELVKKAGFKNIHAEPVSKIGESSSAKLAAKGFSQGSQLASQLKDKDSDLGEKIQIMAEREFINQLGDHPMKSKLKAWVFEAVK